jgi:UDP-N-acetylglucosamine diphosphorylase/glucosamine-1-phosphate N-acetyltransferase
MTIVLFEDPQVTQLYPVTVGRPAFTISCASYRLIDLVGDWGIDVCTMVRPHLRAVQQADFPDTGFPHASGPGSAAAEGKRSGKPVALVNARLVPTAAAARRIKDALCAGRPGAVAGPQGMALAILPADSPLPPEAIDANALAEFVSGLKLPRLDFDLPLFVYPHDIVRHHLESLSANLEYRLAGGAYREIAEGVFAAADAQLGQHVVADTRSGPIVLEERAQIGPFCYLSGPAHLGAGARVIEHSAIKDGVSLGHTTKIGGEIEGSIIEPYTNKQHHGFLGHSYLGSWVNLGAGTCNSDLKNTYGQVNMEYAGQKVATGMQFVGAIIGDYAKTAINTGIFTGKTIGACSMIYGFVTTNVPSFVNYARLFGQVTEAPVEVMAATQSRMFARRNVAQRPCDIQLLHDMYELTRHERQLAGEPLSL